MFSLVNDSAAASYGFSDIDLSKISPKKPKSTPSPTACYEQIWNAAHKQTSDQNTKEISAVAFPADAFANINDLTTSPVSPISTRTPCPSPVMEEETLVPNNILVPINTPAARRINAELLGLIDSTLHNLVLNYLGMVEIDGLFENSFLEDKLRIGNLITAKIKSLKAVEMGFHICDFIESHRLDWQKAAKEKNENLYIIPTGNPLLRPIQYNTDNTIFIHFTKKKEGDIVIGSGSYKTVKLALDYYKNEWFASSSIGARHAQDKENHEGVEEVAGLKLAQGIDGIIQMKYDVNYRSKKGTLKTRVITPLYEIGTLEKLIKEGVLEDELRIGITHHLIRALFNFHEQGLLHRDLKPANILIGEYLCIADLGTYSEMGDGKRLWQHRTTSWWASPEYAKAKIAGTSLVPVTTDKLDVWSLGCIILDLFSCPKGKCSNLPWAKASSASSLEALSKLDQSFFPEPADKRSLLHLIWEMLSIDPAKRPSMAVVKETFYRCREMEGK